MGNEASLPLDMCATFDADEIKRLGKRFVTICLICLILSDLSDLSDMSDMSNFSNLSNLSDLSDLSNLSDLSDLSWASCSQERGRFRTCYFLEIYIVFYAHNHFGLCLSSLCF